jgi:transposase
MMPTRKRYTTEFKQEAVRLALQGVVPKTQVARELGLTEKMLHSWINQFGPAKPDQPPPLTADERNELVRLRRELKRTQEERDILKKALGIFSMER